MFLGSFCYLVLFACASITVDKAYARPGPATTTVMLCGPAVAQSTICCSPLPTGQEDDDDDDDTQHLCLLLTNEGERLIATESIQNEGVVLNTSISSIGVICENLETKGGQTCIDVTRYDRSEFCFSTLFTNNSEVIKTLPICLDLPSLNVTKLAGLTRRAFPDFGGGGLTTIFSPAQIFNFFSRGFGGGFPPGFGFGGLPGFGSGGGFPGLGSGGGFPGFGSGGGFPGFGSGGGFPGFGSGGGFPGFPSLGNFSNFPGFGSFGNFSSIPGLGSIGNFSNIFGQG